MELEVSRRLCRVIERGGVMVQVVVIVELLVLDVVCLLEPILGSQFPPTNAQLRTCSNSSWCCSCSCFQSSFFPLSLRLERDAEPGV